MINRNLYTNAQIIGYWYSESEPQYPMPIENTSVLSYEQENAFVQKLLYILNDKNTQCNIYRGCSCCRICNTFIGNKEYLILDKFIIPEGYIHYINKHHIQPDIQLYNILMNS